MNTMMKRIKVAVTILIVAAGLAILALALHAATYSPIILTSVSWNS